MPKWIRAFKLVTSSVEGQPEEDTTHNTPNKADSVLLKRIVGPEHESDISICGYKTCGLIVTGSMESSVLQLMYESINPKSELRNTSDYGLKITAANGEKILILVIF